MEALDKVGCEYGRVSREKINCLLKDIELLREKEKQTKEELLALKEVINELLKDFTALKAKIAWLVGTLAALGSLAGTILTYFLKAIFGGH